MIRLIVLSVFFALSFLTVFPAPTHLLWYISILVTEFSWLFILIVVFLLISCVVAGRYKIACLITGAGSLLLFAIPVIGAYRLAGSIHSVFKRYDPDLTDSGSTPFSVKKMIMGTINTPVGFSTIIYDTSNGLTLDFYRGRKDLERPCVVVVHGGSWAAGDSRQLPELNNELANAGYSVASINYRLAPGFTYPAPVEDLKSALNYLRNHASTLTIDTSRFALLGRSAGGQIVLSAAYTLNDPAIKGVVDFYGPTDMVWGYANPTNPLVLNSRKVMEDYLGGSFEKVPQQYYKSSATETAQSNAAPALLIYGKNDPLVSHIHASRLAAKLDSLHVPHYNIYLPWATHGFDWTLYGPAGQISTWSVFRFLKLIFGSGY